MRILATILHVIDLISEWTGKIVSFTIILIIISVIWSVLGKVYSFRPLFDFSTGTKILFVYVILGAAYSLRVGAHVNMDVLYNRWSRRVRSIVDLVTAVGFFLFIVAMLWVAVPTAAVSASTFHFTLKTLLPPNWPLALLAPIGISLFFLQGLAKFIRDLTFAITGKELA